MNQQVFNRRGMWLIVATAAVTVWGIFGILQRRELGRGGYFYGPDHVVTSVSPGGPGAEAGIHVGDRVVRVAGTPVEELPMQSRWPQPRVGESRRIELERGGELIGADVVYGPPARDPVTSGLSALVVGLSFMGLGLWAYLKVRTHHAARLALMGLAMGLAIVRGPHLGTWDGVPSHIAIASMVLFSVLLLHFLLTFPRSGRVGGSPLATRMMYAVWLLYVAVLVVELIVHPALYSVYGFLAFLLLLGYGGLVLAAGIHALVKTPRLQLQETGMGLILVGFLLAIVPNVLYVVSTLLLPGFRLPGSNYYSLLLIAIPITFALGVRRQALVEEAVVG